MAFPTAVNSQITDAISQSNVKVLGEAPATALAGLYQSALQALALASQNAVNAQQQNNILAEAVTARCAQMICGTPVAGAKS